MCDSMNCDTVADFFPNAQIFSLNPDQNITRYSLVMDNLYRVDTLTHQEPKQFGREVTNMRSFRLISIRVCPAERAGKCKQVQFSDVYLQKNRQKKKKSKCHNKCQHTVRETGKCLRKQCVSISTTKNATIAGLTLKKKESVCVGICQIFLLNVNISHKYFHYPPGSCAHQRKQSLPNWFFFL